MGVLIDSSVFVGVERGELELRSLLAIDPTGPVAMAAITASELLMGLHRADSSRRQARRRRFLDALFEIVPTLSFDFDVAKVHARLGAQLYARGEIIGRHDLIIAATAVAHDLGVMTWNVDEFQRVEDLTLFPVPER